MYSASGAWRGAKASDPAGTTHQLAIPLVIAAAAAGALLGDNLSFFIGRAGGFRLLRRYGRCLGLDKRKLTLGVSRFVRHGGKVVFFGCFVAVLRAWAAFLADTSRMKLDRALVFNAARGLLWGTLYRLAGYLLGNTVHRMTGTVGKITLGLAVEAILASMVFLARNERRLQAEAERAMPGALNAYGGMGGWLAADRRLAPSADQQDRMLDAAQHDISSRS
jgi:membrane protein DedA with SNARE-associated domain